MKILSIGNSFSQDAQRYLHRLAKKEGVDIKAVNLYIPGCTLQSHYNNMLSNACEYDFELNGEKTGKQSSIKEALESDSWDYVTLQQASPYSGIAETFSPFVTELAKFVRERCKGAKILIHQTWAYEDGSEKLKNLGIFSSAKEMLAGIISAYERAAELISADGIIPSGQAMMCALDMGIGRVHRDTFHASLGVGRYLLALAWYKVLTASSISDNSFDELDEPITEKEREIIIRAVNSVI